MSVRNAAEPPADRILLDTSSLMYRAFFSMPTSVKDPSGNAVNAFHGYLDMTARLTGSRKPREIVHMYDADWRPAPRVALYAGYKANRAADPEELPAQFDFLRELLDAIGASQAEAPGWEAEDAIGSLIGTEPAPRSDAARTDIVSGDRDLIQLVRDPHVRLLFTIKGVSRLLELDEAGVLEKYGVPADRYAEFAILRGDPSDGLPGVRGVGEKTARALISAYPSLEEVVAGARSGSAERRPLKGSPHLRARISESADYIATMREVVMIRRDLDVREWAPEPDRERADALAETHRVASPLKRLRAAEMQAGRGRG
ncbi:MAG: 5'-3' exonuclease [Actinomycetota bacterium]|nr:5'-3' exonuclease [Actinomycetota bacterium]